VVYAASDIVAIESLFGEPKTILWREKATKEETLTQASGHGYAHFSCHGQYNWDTPSRSALLLAESLARDEEGRPIINYERALTLAEVEANLDLGQTRVVTLSACETGLSEALGPRAEEYVGLPAGFLLAGAPAVVASLWAVYELSTVLLMERFYMNHLRGDPDENPKTRSPLSPSEALRRAQIWLRDEVTAQEAAERCDEQIDKLESKGQDVPTWLSRAWRKYAQMARKTPDSRPFAHPFHWAAFALYGAAQDPEQAKGADSYA
jgi:CHAT domain-containing protein